MERTALGNRLTDQLKQFFPQVLRWFDNPSSAVVGELLQCWPTLEELQKARPATILKFLQTHCRGEERRNTLLEDIARAVPATRDPALLRAAKLATASLVGLLAQLRTSIADYDREIEAIVKAHPDFSIVDSFPGVGPALAPRLIAALGSDRGRFATAQEVQCYSGIAPVVESSGRQRWVHWRWACPKFVRQTFHEWAQHSIAKSAWARAYYEQQRARGKDHHAAVRALAFKWIRILFRCWKDRKPYDEAFYTATLGERKPQPSPELASQPPSEPASPPPHESGLQQQRQHALQIQWKSCGGFSKPILIQP